MLTPRVLNEEEIRELESGADKGTALAKLSALDLLATPQAKDAEIMRLREIEEAAREYRKLVWVPAVMVFAGTETPDRYPVWRDYEDAQRKLDALLGKGETKNV